MKALGTLVREHIFKMFDHLNTLETLGGEIDAEFQIHIILESLSNSFNQFKLNYRMDKINFTLAALINTLQVADGIIKGHPSINNVKKASFSKSFPKEKGKWEKKKATSNPNKVLNLFMGIGKVKKVNDSKP